MKISFSTKTPAATDALVVGAFEKRRLSPGAAEIDAKTKGALKQAMAADRFTGAENEFLDVLAPAGVKTRRVVVAGLGKADALDALAAQKLGGNLVAHLNRVGAKRAAVDVDGVTDGADIPATDFAANVAYGMRLRGYRFGKYRTKEKPKDKPTLDKLTIVVRRARTASAAFGELDRIADGVFFTRDLVSEPANVIYPESLARRARTLSKLGVKVEVLDVARMRKLGMGALLGVGQGSARGSRMVVMRWNGAPKGSKAPPVAFVGKGVTFDTGGISIKPAGGMEDMKWDMAGAGVVIGLMKVLAGRGARLDAVGVVGLVENMPSATAQRPGDVVTSMSGQTIEVINTDAEGRLVLADALWYCRSRFKPRVMVNLATLTGAIIVANFPGMDVKPGSMGRPVPGVEVGILDEEYRPEAPGKEGHLAVRPGWPSMFCAYWDDEELYNSRFRRGWYITGDRARMDDDGYFWFGGRADEVAGPASPRPEPFDSRSIEYPVGMRRA
ncbi:MAG: leucyl aminopeptidase [Proteobacteria bacterium]|nr:leucyl aminopeptidase [Pseudomonadota bacterium]